MKPGSTTRPPARGSAWQAARGQHLASGRHSTRLPRKAMPRRREARVGCASARLG